MPDRDDIPRDASFRDRVLALVRAIPGGRVATYGQIAGLAGSPRAARVIGGILRSAPDEVPWHRVVNAQGGISTYRVGAGELQEALLAVEGVEVRNRTLDLAAHRWRPFDEHELGSEAASGWGTMPGMDRPDVRIARDLVRASSPSGRESPAARVLADACTELGFDEVEVDAAGNVLAWLRRGEGPTLMLNGHLDTVPVGDEAKWPYPPLSGAIEGGFLWGRGTSDMKASLACMAVAAARAAEVGFAGTVVLAGVVQEEVGGLGARHLAETQRVDVVVLGEPSSLRLMRGHRGRIEVDVELPGKIAHAAKSELGENALYRAAAYLERLRHLELPAGGPLGASTATPTRLVSHPQDGANVVPGSAVLTIDYRNLPTDTVEDVVERLQSLDPDARVVVPIEEASSENGEVEKTYPRVNDGYLIPEDDPWLEKARASLRASLAAHDVAFDEGVWWFATDAPMLAEGGTPVLGFGPGDPEVAHTTRECVSVDAMAIATDAYADLIRACLPLTGGSR